MIRGDAAGKTTTATDRAAFDEAFAAVYPTLNRIADACMWRKRSGHTLQATALVSETYLRLLRDRGAGCRDPEHLLGIAARSMRQVLIEHARAHGAGKRGAGAEHLTLSAALDLPAAEATGVDLFELDEAIAALELGNPRQATIVQLRYFGGMSVDETAVAMKLSPATIKREWTLARLWLLRSLRGDAPHA